MELKIYSIRRKIGSAANKPLLFSPFLTVAKSTLFSKQTVNLFNILWRRNQCVTVGYLLETAERKRNAMDLKFV